MSPPTRGAWIEMPLRLESCQAGTGRPPHGGRGLKLECPGVHDPGVGVAPHTGGVD